MLSGNCKSNTESYVEKYCNQSVDYFSDQHDPSSEEMEPVDVELSADHFWSCCWWVSPTAIVVVVVAGGRFDTVTASDGGTKSDRDALRSTTNSVSFVAIPTPWVTWLESINACSFCFFLSFIRRFWNQILICVSWSWRCWASSARRFLLRYLLVQNSWQTHIN